MHVHEDELVPSRGSGTAVREMLERHLAQFGLGDDSWARELEALRHGVDDGGSPWDGDLTDADA
jgi:hypothetical protein